MTRRTIDASNGGMTDQPLRRCPRCGDTKGDHLVDPERCPGSGHEKPGYALVRPTVSVLPIVGPEMYYVSIQDVLAQASEADIAGALCRHKPPCNCFVRSLLEGTAEEDRP